MTTFLTDEEIDRLIRERKQVPADLAPTMRIKRKRLGFLEREIPVSGSSNGAFSVIIRQSTANPLDFSVILCYHPENTNARIRLRRYNGKNHEHTNRLEGDTFYDFHVHHATQRYQEAGLAPEEYATPSDAYSDVSGAIKCLLADCGFDVPPDRQYGLFDVQKQ